MKQDSIMNLVLSAIQDKKTLTLSYDGGKNGPDPKGTSRHVDPYAAYPNKAKDKILIDCQHISGYSTSVKQRWQGRTFDITLLRNIKVARASTNNWKDYKPESDRYVDAIVKR